MSSLAFALALVAAKSEGFDVVLVDTAGRMQDNAPLMRSLTQLIKVNRPDLVLFVGEALVGNEAVDQLTKFNKVVCVCARACVCVRVRVREKQRRELHTLPFPLLLRLLVMHSGAARLFRRVEPARD